MIFEFMEKPKSFNATGGSGHFATQIVVPIKKENKMTENCKHRPHIIEIFPDFSKSDIKCQYCGVELTASWTVKQEPMRVEFEAYFSVEDNKLIAGPVSHVVADKLTIPGKRFHVTCVEIVEGE